MVTQAEIAQQVGLDVSSVNKILNKRAGAVFKKETIARVMEAAKRLGYDFSHASKGKYTTILQMLFPRDQDNSTLADQRRVTLDFVRKVKAMLYRGAGGAAIVLLVLRSVIGL